MGRLSFRIWLHLSGDVRSLLCTVHDPCAVSSVIECLCRVAEPGYMRIDIELFKPLEALP